MTEVSKDDLVKRLRGFDTCMCGDYRKDHAGGTGACIHNKPRDMTHGYKDCTEFRLHREAVVIPPPYVAPTQGGQS